MKILSPGQLKSADRYTIGNEPVTSIDLMERAAEKCFDFILNELVPAKAPGEPYHLPFTVFCGKGNNGGDGLAIARMLKKSGFNVNVYIINHTENAGGDFLTNQKRLEETGQVMEIISNENDEIKIEKNSIVIDALLGAGLNKPTEGILKHVIQKINSAESTVISIDMPSGLFMEDNTGNPKEGVVCADYTLTFQCPKLAFLFSENEKFTGKWNVLDIGLDQDFIASLDANYFFLQKDFIRTLFKPRSKFSHKGTNGHALIVSGSQGKAGAAVLCSKSCLRSGAGLVTACIPKGANAILQTAVPEVMTITDEENDYISALPYLENYNAIGAGPGLGMEQQTQNTLKLLIQNTKVPLVLDADALNILSENKTWLAFLPAGSVLTPHPKEFERLFGKSSGSYERLLLQRENAVKLNCVIVLKGAHTSIATPGGNVYFNSTGNPGMATAGSGDVLTGIITGLMAQGYNGYEASVTGVYLHGLAGDIAAHEHSQHGIIASDITENFGKAVGEMFEM